MTIDEYRKKLDMLSDEEFSSFNTDLGGGQKTRYERVSEYVSNPQYERRICQLLQMNTDAERMTKSAMRSTLAAVATALIAGVAVYVSVLLAYQTNERLKHTEQPIIAAIKSECTGKLIKSNTTVEIDFNLKFKNVGKNPAKNLRMRIWVAQLEDPNTIAKVFDETIVNRIHQGAGFSWNRKINWPLPFTYSPEQGRNLDSLKKRPQLFIYVRADYDDGFNLTKPGYDDLYFIYTLGKVSVEYASTDQKRRFQPYIDRQLSEKSAQQQ